ncbi:glycerol kinase GlpK [Alteromonas mediterranea]|uniref:Glycerol kinase n=1 Tax=Alteromonas mediterranea (strain DSM 17117 / CIP 110805 / LMG 28347 / Deep ecotype) TaxID=1774373 RepID=GLPK_ALTMD|nr:glycerol kinase GlpK [Alteromonas mediterranea]B4S2H6.1 RecName: Full=Glycerol kinase; AltName: Full=ATP:glycerol 3-phosphotransferase; AltName: Full=Glycerokinase; Short=GK [Alteromonas mediterranea DE]AEA96386.1 glycerol kinase [Alteromonas mediterranea DE]MBR9784615.1 glycerol kinase GlpK [Gammaproteobacteria bacterium]CAH1218643.1 Glycerol kinase [Alteromonas mediterranea]
MGQHILAIDQGTTSSRSIIFSPKRSIDAIAQQEFSQKYPKDGWVEHDPEEIWESVVSTLKEVFNKCSVAPSDIAAIGITNQRETTLVWDKHSGKPVYNAIVWQDRRTAQYCRDFSEDEAFVSYITEATGLLLDPYFSATKIAWILDNVEGAREKAENGDLLFGTVDSYLIWRLTGGESHKTDATNASRTMLFDIHNQCWDEKLLSKFNIPASMLPEVMDCAADFGVIKEEIIGRAIPIQGVAGDQQAALVGQACFEKGMAKSTYGTGCFMILNTGDAPLQSKNRLLTTVGYRLNGKTTYALEGSIFMAGATVQWLRDGLKLIDDAAESEALAQRAREDNGVFLVPAFTGLGAPYWDPDARGAILGLTRDTGISEIVAAGLQSVCYQTKDLQKAMESDGARPTTIRVDGGMSRNDWVMGFLSDILGAEVERPEITETTALGAAFLAGLQAGVFNSIDDLTHCWKSDSVFTPRLTKQERDQAYDGWKSAVARIRCS